MPSQKQLIRRGFMLAATLGVVALAAVGSSVQAGRVMAAGRTPAALGTCTINWTGTAGDHQWTTTTNWNPVRVPTTTDYACVPSTYSQTVILSTGTNVVNGVNLQGSGFQLSSGSLELTDATQASSMNNLTFAGGSLQVDTSVALGVPGAWSWTGGDLKGGGTTTIPSGSTLTMNGGGGIHAGQTLSDAGAIIWTGGGFCVGDGAILNINGGATFSAASTEGQSISNCYGGATPRMHVLSTGSFTRSGTATNLYVGTPFDNDGTVTVSSGNLELSGGNFGASTDNGSYSVASGTILRLSAGTRTFGTISGAGTFQVSGGTNLFTGTSLVPTTVSGGSLELNNTSVGGVGLGTLTFSGGTIQVDSGVNLNLSGAWSWTGGDLKGPGTTNIKSTSTLSMSGGGGIHLNQTLNNAGTVNWTTGGFCVGDGAVLNNAGTFNDNSTNGQSISNCYGGSTPRVHNQSGGTFTRNGTGGEINYIYEPFDNDGTVHLISGDLNLQYGNSGVATDSGAYNLDASTSLQLSGGTRTFAGAATVTGAGTLALQGGTAVFNGTAVGGTSIANLAESAGTAQGTFTITGSDAWSGGDINGTGTATVGAAATMTVTGGGGIHNAGRVLTNAGTINWTAGSFCLGDGAILNINSGATFNAASTDGQSIYNCYGGATPRMHILSGGSFTRSGSATNLYVGTPFDNDGTVGVASGNLELSGGNFGASTDTGSYTVASGTILRLSSGTRTFSTISGAGTFQVSGGTNLFTGTSLVPTTLSAGSLELNNTSAGGIGLATLTLSAGTIQVDSGVTLNLSGAWNWTGGDLKGPGTTNITSTSTLTVSGGGGIHLNLTLNNQGTINWTNSAFCVGDGAVLNNAGTFNDNSTNGQSIYNCYGGSTPRVHNQSGGTFTRNGTGGEINYIGEGFDNDGTVHLISGNLNLQSGNSGVATDSGAYNLDASTSLQLSGGTRTFAGAATVGGAGALALEGGTAVFNGTAVGGTSIANLAESSGSAQGTFTITSTDNWTGGDINGAGTTTVAASATMTVTGGGGIHNVGRVLSDAGTINWTAGSFCVGDGAILNILSGATFNAASTEGQSISNCYGGVAPRVHVLAGGTFNRGGTATNLYVYTPFDNDGTVAVASGNLELSGGNSGAATDGGAYSVATGTTLRLSAATRTFGTISGTGTLQVSGGANLFTGTSLVPSTVSGGSLELNNTSVGGVALGTLTFTGGTLQVDGGVNLNLSGTWSWTGGDLKGPGTTNVTSTSTLAMNGGGGIHVNLTLNNAGTINWTTGGFCVGDGAVLNNAGTFNDNSTNGQSISNCYGGGVPRVHNQSGGTFTRNGTAGEINYIGEGFDNDGTVHLISGDLNLQSGNSGVATDSGAYNLDASTSLQLSGGTRTFAGAATVTGAGTLALQSGTAVFNGTGVGGTSIANLAESGGSAQGTFTITGTDAWTGGDINGAGTTTVAASATMTVTGGGGIHNVGRVLSDAGTINWTAGSFCVGDGAILNITSGANFNDQSSNGQSLYNCYGGANPRVHVLSGGTFTRNGPAGEINYVGEGFDNDGTVHLSSGDLNLQSGNSGTASDSGAYTMAAGTNLQLSGGTRTFASGATLGGGGTLAQQGGTAVFNGTNIPILTESGGTLQGTFTITGSDTWTGGDINGTGTTTIASGAILTVNGGGGIHASRVLTNAGTINWTGGSFCIGDGATLNNNSVFNDQSSNGQTIYNCYGGATPQLTNGASGTFNVNISGTNYMSVPFANNGTLEISAGILNFQENYTQPAGGTFETVIGGSTPGSGFGQLQISGTGTMGGHLVLINASGFTPSVGQAFQVITCTTSCTGSFATISGTYSVTYNPNDVTVVAANPISTVSKLQYSLANSNGTTWMDIDPNGLRVSFTPGVNSIALVSGNADLWTANAGYNQDIGITLSGGSYPTVSGQPEAWKESGGFAGTFSPNAAYVQTAIPVSGGTTYTAKLQWKTNKNAAGATIYAGAGPIGPAFSPTRMSVMLVPVSSATVTSKTSTSQYQLANSNGTTWQDMDGTNLSTTITPAADSMAWIGANADLWTASAGYNQDVGITISGGAFPTTAGQPEAWKESGGFAGTFSPNAAMAQTVVPLTHGVAYTIKLQWKTNKNAPGATIFAGAGPIGGKFSPSSLIVQLFPAGANPAKAISSSQYHLTSSDGTTWQDIDATNLNLSVTPTSTCLATVSGNADLWTANAGYNQDLGIAVSGGSFPSTAGQPEAWKESGGFAGNFSPNAAYVQTVLQLNGGTTYTFRLQWKANRNAAGASIYAGAGPIGGKFSPTSLTVQLSC